MAATNGREGELFYIVADEDLSNDGINMKLYRSKIDSGATIRRTELKTSDESDGINVK
jgi:hypothetical protein